MKPKFWTTFDMALDSGIANATRRYVKYLDLDDETMTHIVDYEASLAEHIKAAFYEYFDMPTEGDE